MRISKDAEDGSVPKRTGVFSTLEYHSDSGDLAGIELLVVDARDGYMAIVQVAKGVPEVPVVVPISISGSTISFEMMVGRNRLRFEGTIRADGIYGRFDNHGFSDRADGFFLLRRGNSYWQ